MMHLHHRYLVPLLIGLTSALTLGCDKVTDLVGTSTGSIQVTSSNDGATIDWDPDGFLVAIDDGGAARLPVNGMFVRNLSLGAHRVALSGIAPNCSTTSPNPQTLELTAERPSLAAHFEVECQPNLGSLRISTVTTGDDIDPNGYQLFAPQYNGQSILSNGTITFPNVRAGVFNVALDGVAPNCKHLGSPVRPTEIFFGKTTEVVFTLRCSLSGRFQITTTTSGVDLDQNGYRLELSNGLKESVSVLQIPSNGTTEITGLPEGDYSLAIQDLANNCFSPMDVISPAGIAAGAVTALSFEINCEATNQIAYSTATGVGSRLNSIRSNGSENFLLVAQLGSSFDPAWLRDGSRLAYTNDGEGSNQIYAMDPDGRNAIRLTNGGVRNYRPDWSPDGKRIAFVSERDGNAEIYVMDADGSNSIRLTNNLIRDDAPSWSPDGKRIVFQTERDGIQGLWTMNADGSEESRLPGTINGDERPAWSPDGSKIAFSRRVTQTIHDIFTIGVDGSRLTQVSFNYADASDPSWSPDGRQIAFSATFCTGDFYYYYTTCVPDVLLARTDGRLTHSTPVVAVGYNPAWRQ